MVLKFECRPHVEHSISVCKLLLATGYTKSRRGQTRKSRRDISASHGVLCCCLHPDDAPSRLSTRANEARRYAGSLGFSFFYPTHHAQ